MGVSTRSPMAWPPRVLVVQSESVAAGSVTGDQSAVHLEYAADAVTALLVMSDTPPEAVIVPTDIAGVDVTLLTQGVVAWHDLLVLIALADHPDAVRVATAALSAGAAGLLSTPLSVAHVTPNLRRLLSQRSGNLRPPGPRGAVEMHGIALDLDAMEVRSSTGQRVHLSSMQFACLHALARVAPSFVTTEQLAYELGLSGDNHLERTRRVLRRLRDGLTEAAFPAGLIENVRFKGYRLSPVAQIGPTESGPSRTTGHQPVP